MTYDELNVWLQHIRWRAFFSFLRYCCMVFASIAFVAMLLRISVYWPRWTRDTRFVSLGLLVLFASTVQSFAEVLIQSIPPGPRTVGVFIALLWVAIGSVLGVVNEWPTLTKRFRRQSRNDSEERQEFTT